MFYDLSPGPWKVLAEPPGYYPYRTTETISAGQRVDATYHVEKASYNPYDVTVTASRPRKEVSRTVIAADEIDKVPGGAGDPLTVVQNFAGVARSIEGFLIVRGSAPEDSQFFLDGTTIPFIYHFGGLKSVFPNGILESIEFYPGNFSPMYGRATGGIVDVRVKELKPKKVGGYADVSLLDTGVFLEVPLGDKGGIALAGRRSYIDGVLNLAVPSDAPVSLVTAPVYYDFHLLGNYRPSPAHDLRTYFLLSDDRLELLFDNPADIEPGFEGNRINNATTSYRSLLTYRYVPGAEVREHAAAVGRARSAQPERRPAPVRPGHLHRAAARLPPPSASATGSRSRWAPTSCGAAPTRTSRCRCRPRRGSRPTCSTSRSWSRPDVNDQRTHEPGRFHRGRGAAPRRSA